MRNGQYPLASMSGLYLQGVVFKDDVYRVLCFRMIFAGCYFSERYL